MTEQPPNNQNENNFKTLADIQNARNIKDQEASTKRWDRLEQGFKFKARTQSKEHDEKQAKQAEYVEEKQDSE